MKTLFTLGAVAAFTLLSGCSTTQTVTAGPQARIAPMTRACFSPHGGRSKSTDDAIQRTLETHSIAVLTAPDCTKDTPGVDMSVTYSDKWWWDIVMYPVSIDIRFYSAPAGGLIATGHWKNSVAHQFPSVDGLVEDLMNDMFAQTGEPGVIRTSKQAAQ
jgi:hypothetical protein